MTRYCWFLLLPVLAACDRDDRSTIVVGTQESFVAEDAGQIPLTSPGTPILTDRPVMEFPMLPMDEVPAPVAEDPLGFSDTIEPPAPPEPPPAPPLPPDPPAVLDSPRGTSGVAPAPRQQRRSDTLLPDRSPVPKAPAAAPRPSEPAASDSVETSPGDTEPADAAGLGDTAPGDPDASR